MFNGFHCTRIKVRIYLNKNTSSTNTNDERKEESGEEEIEVVEDDTDSTESLQEWTKNKMRGFKRANPASTATPKVPTKAQAKPKPKSATKTAPNESKSTGTTSGKQETPPSSPNVSPPDDSSQSNSDRLETETEKYKGKYCHYFVNQGRCNFEERTGLKCRFEHKIAPMCNFGISCSRTKCMFSHPKLNGGNNDFLGKSTGYPPMMNPWQTLNPWMNPQNQFLPNPWNTQRGQQTQ